MEEYDADINYHFIDFGDGRLEITTDIDDQPEYLTVEERVGIILKHLDELFVQATNDLDGYEENENEFRETLSDIADMRDLLISAVLNMWYNKCSDYIEDSSNCDIEYSLAMYKHVMNNKTGDDMNILFNTAYSSEMNILEPLNGCAAFIQDTAEQLLDLGIDKDMVKATISTLTEMQIKIVNEFIDEYEVEEIKKD